LCNFFIEKLKKLGRMFYVRWAVIFVLAVCFGFGVLGPLLHYVDGVAKTAVETSAAKKKLPIYCVGTEEKKVAISFDAAWGECRLRSNLIRPV